MAPSRQVSRRGVPHYNLLAAHPRVDAVIAVATEGRPVNSDLARVSVRCDSRGQVVLRRRVQDVPGLNRPQRRLESHVTADGAVVRGPPCHRLRLLGSSASCSLSDRGWQTRSAHAWFQSSMALPLLDLCAEHAKLCIKFDVSLGMARVTSTLACPYPNDHSDAKRWLYLVPLATAMLSSNRPTPARKWTTLHLSSPSRLSNGSGGCRRSKS